MRPCLVLSQSMQEQIIRESRQGEPDEICGIIRGRDGVAKELVPAANVATDRHINYQVDNKVLMMQFHFEEVGDTMIAIYHSHPASEAYPSATDAWSAHYPDAHYIICSLAVPGAQIRSFLLRDIYPECNLDALVQQVVFDETRPGLFAYYASAATKLPPALQVAGIAEARPFYVVYARPDSTDNPEVRFIQVVDADIVTAHNP